MIRGIRGATTVDLDSETCIREATIALMEALIETNQLHVDDVITLFITVTDDLHTISPARVIREQFNWDLVPILCAKEPDIHGLPDRCIRVLIQFNSDKSAADIRHIYQNNATVLRPDR